MRVSCGLDACSGRCQPPDAKQVFECGCCGEGILEEDGYVVLGGTHIHKDCLGDNYTAIEVYEEMGGRVCMASFDDYVDTFILGYD